MSYHPDDTICAIATAPGGAARGMLRVSGPDAIGIVASVFCPADGSNVENVRRPTAVAGHAIVALHDERPRKIPCDTFLWPTARSYTREPVAELHTLGSPPLLDALAAAVCRAGARLAEPGEFTLRAFLAGRIDLTQAEAVLGVIDAPGPHELTTALSQLAGGLARPLQTLRDDLLQLLAELEAGLDFVEDDIEFISKETLLARLDSASRLLADVATQMTSRGTATQTTQVALVGAPNAGKSSLFNAIVARFGVRESSPAMPAIVSPQSGTTRDYVTATIEIDGARCELVDTAGKEPLPRGESQGAGTYQQENHATTLTQEAATPDIDAAAQSLAAERQAAATLRLWCIDATDIRPRAIGMTSSLLDAETGEIVVLTKSDLARGSQETFTRQNHAVIIATSSRTGEGIDALCGCIRTLLTTAPAARQGQAVASTAERCRDSIRLADSAISRAIEITSQQSGEELAAAELRIALAELGKVVGAVYTDDLLDRIFSTFCIGK